MKFTVAIPLGDISAGEFQTAQAAAEMGRALEAAGVDACYLTDHPAPDSQWLHKAGHDALDPFAAFAFVAAATTELRFHTNILVMPYRNPFLTAKSAATLQVLSGGRLILGLGAGYQKAEFDALGIDFHRRGRIFDEALEVLRLAWSGGPVTYAGQHFSADAVEPRPVPNPPPPIWIGGGSDTALERAARWGDGWCPFFVAPYMSSLNRDTGIHSVPQLASKIAQLSERREELGRSGPFDVCIGPLERIHYGKRGGADAWMEVVRQLAEAGVEWITVEPPHRSRQHYLECVQWFGEEVISRFR